MNVIKRFNSQIMLTSVSLTPFQNDANKDELCNDYSCGVCPEPESPRSIVLGSDPGFSCALPGHSSGADSHFVVRATLSGESADVLIDTGATMSLISPSHAKRVSESSNVEIKECDPLNVLLADSSSVKITRCLETKVCISDHTTECTLFEMALPSGYDVLLGMDWLQNNNVWLQPKTKRIIMPTKDQPGGIHVCLSNVHGMLLPIKQTRKPNAKRPIGVFALSCGDPENEVELCSASEFNRREKLMNKGELAWSDCAHKSSEFIAASATNEQTKTNTSKSRKRKQSSESESKRSTHDKRGGEPVPSSSDTTRLEGEEEITFLVEINFEPGKSEPEIMVAAVEESTSTRDEPSLPTLAIPKAEINKTMAEHQNWVEELKAQKIEKFSCLDELKKFVPHPDDEPLKIRLKKGAVPPQPRRYRVPVHLLPQLKEFIRDMIDKGWIEESDSAWASPVLVIKKPGVNADGTPKNGWRFVVDMSKMNQCIEAQQYHIPDVHEMWAKLQGSKYISLLDLKSGYWLCPLEKESRQYTSFTTPYGTYKYTVAPMGMLTSAAHFQRFVERKLEKHNLLYKRVVLSGPKCERDQAMESRTPIEDVDDSVTPEVQGGGDTTFGHLGFAGVYQDDIIVMSDTAEEHKAHLRSVLRCLSTEKLYVAPNKMALFCRYVRYLGAICGNDVLCVDPLKVEAIDSMPVPKNARDVRTFLGACGFLRRWISNYSAKISPLNALLKKGVDVEAEWNESHDKAVAEVKGALTSYPVLRQFDPNLPSTIVSDACDTAVGGALCQTHEGKLAVVAYCSQCLRGPQLNYSVQEKEAYGVLVCVGKFRHYVLHSRFQLRLRTDHESLKFLQTQDKGLVGRMARWAMKLSDYNMDISYIRGPANTLADALSRLVCDCGVIEGKAQCILSLYPETQRMVHAAMAAHEGVRVDGGGENSLSETSRLGFKGEEAFMRSLNTATYDPDTLIEQALFARTYPTSRLEITAADYKADKDFGLLFRSHTRAGSLTDKETKQISARKDKYYVLNGLLWHICPGGDTICVPQGTASQGRPDIRTRVLMELHDTCMAGHRGIQETYNAVRRRYTWPKLHGDVEKYVQSCDTCQASKKSKMKPGGTLQPLTIPLTHGTHYSMDFLTDLPDASTQGYNAVMVVVDRFSKRVWLIPTWKKADSQTTAELFFNSVVRHNGAPLEIVSDRDPKFTSNFWRSLWARMGTSLRLSSARSQQTDGQTERAITVVEEILRTCVNYKQDNWVDMMTAVEFSINNSVAASTGMAPLFVETGRHALVPIDIGMMPMQMDTVSVVDAAKRVAMDTYFATAATASCGAVASRYLQRVRTAHQRARDALQSSRMRMEETAAKGRRDVSFKVGDKVWLSAEGITLDVHRERACAKLVPVYYGPYVITESITPVSYRIKLPSACKIHDVFHVRRLKSAHENGFRNRKAVKLPMLTDGSYEVSQILSDRVKYGKIEYLVRWKGYSMNESTWQPEDDLNNCDQLLKAYKDMK